ncbi:ESX-1 secretion-associated protein EspK [Mycobacterium basiliense]|uniref:ESX-1 secretion-associated protein EspK n=1 Tax=Mycobacterium basiliense TaxID=2094119 RepID=A0A447G809_9MYCO|nr:hypothetical protein [Mycobacterium basiliense]VDM86615.1 ESX-1 secretion-associated protein EspK [Mycobacterium basiliense]
MPVFIKEPKGPYAEEMLEPNGWPDVYEVELLNQARDYFMVHKQLAEVHSACVQQMAEIFDGGVWSGDAAQAAHAKLSDVSSRLQTVVTQLKMAYIWYGDMSALVTRIKEQICITVEEAQAEITELEAAEPEDPAAPAEIAALIAAANASNTSLVVTVAAALQTGLGLIPEDMFPSIDINSPGDYLPDLDFPIPPLPAPISNKIPKPVKPLLGKQTSASAGTPSDTLQPASGGAPAGLPLPTSAGTAALSPLSSLSALSSLASMSNAGMSGSSGAGPADPPSSEPSAPAAGAAAGTLAASGRGAPGAGGLGMRPQFLGPQTLANSVLSQTSPAAPGASAASMPPFASGGAVAGPSASVGAPMGRAASGRPPTTPAADKSTDKAPVNARHAADSDSTDDMHAAEVGALTLIPVAVARAARDAIAAATTPQLAEKPDPLTLARRIAAALNAPDAGANNDFGFFWVTAVTTDDAIVVANSYGLAYIPDGVQLPVPVHMASADEAMPASERARWATYPVMAVQGWAAHRDTALRAVIATEEQLADCDPGAPKILLQPDDIPATGAMSGRSRLEIVDPPAAKRLAATTDAHLIDLMPPAPVDANPADQRHTLWFEVLKPLASDCAGRDVAHLVAFARYAAHTQEVLLWQAHTAVDATAQRTAVADWLYWRHLTGLLDHALAGAL